MKLKDKIHAYLCLIRIQGAILESMFIITGALIVGARDFGNILILFLIGFMFHVYVYVLNEYIDVEIDSTSPELQKKPLVNGALPKRHAIIISILGLIGVFVLTIIFFPSLPSLICITLAVVSYGIYDVFGNKKIPGFAEFIGSVPYFFLFLFGVITITTQFTTVINILGLLFFFKAVFGYVVEGELQDADHDNLTGGNTLALALGVHVKDRKLILTTKYRAFVFTLIGICLFLIILLIFQPEINFYYSNIMKLVIMIPLGLLIAIPTYKLLNPRIFDRSKIKKYYVLIDVASIALLYIILMPLLGIELVLFLIILPITWYATFSIILYGQL